MSLVARVVAWLAEQGPGAYLVGGCVRDQYLNQAVYDLDIAVAGDGLAVARRLADRFGGKYYALDRQRRTGRAILQSEEGRRLVVDVARFRGDDLTADLAGRDFTVNALAASVHTPDEVIDQHGGLGDLETGILRPVSDSSIRNDPLRALRAVRLAAQLGFTLSSELVDLIERDGGELAQVPGERSRDELARLLDRPDSASYIEKLDELGLLTILLPELEPLRHLAQPRPHCMDGLSHSLATVRALELVLAGFEGEHAGGESPESLGFGPGAPGWRIPESILRFGPQVRFHLAEVMSDLRPRRALLKVAALLHDVGKPLTHRVEEGGRARFIGHDREGGKIAAGAVARLRFSAVEVRFVETIVRNHMRPLMLARQGHVTARAVYRFFRDCGEVGVDVLLHALADHRATYGLNEEDVQLSRLEDLTSRMLADYWELQSRRVSPPTLINGHDLLREFELEPGPQIGALLETVREAQAGGRVTTREEALALVRERLECGATPGH